MPKSRRWPAGARAELSAFVDRFLAEYGLDRADIIAELRNPTPKPTRRQRKRLHPDDPVLIRRMVEKMAAGQSITLASESVAAEEDLDVANTSRRLRNAFNREYRTVPQSYHHIWVQLAMSAMVLRQRCGHDHPKKAQIDDILRSAVIEMMRTDNIDGRKTQETEEFLSLCADLVALVTAVKPLIRKKSGQNNR
jgi:hypothetical protein